MPLLKNHNRCGDTEATLIFYLILQLKCDVLRMFRQGHCDESQRMTPPVGIPRAVVGMPYITKEHSKVWKMLGNVFNCYRGIWGQWCWVGSYEAVVDHHPCIPCETGCIGVSNRSEQPGPLFPINVVLKEFGTMQSIRGPQPAWWFQRWSPMDPIHDRLIEIDSPTSFVVTMHYTCLPHKTAPAPKPCGADCCDSSRTICCGLTCGRCANSGWERK